VRLTCPPFDAPRYAGASEVPDEIAHLRPAVQNVILHDRAPNAYLRKLLRAFVLSSGIIGPEERPRVAELGGTKSSPRALLPRFDFEFLSLYPDDDDTAVRVADICNCPQIESERYHAVFSKAVMEHVRHPWEAGREMTRILKPGGIFMHVAPFSYFYHKAPEDYFRYSPAGLQAIADDLEPLYGEFLGGNRRKDNRGTDVNPVEEDGGSQFTVDDLGGWRENWSSIYVARKPLATETGLRAWRVQQIFVNVIKRATELGHSEADAIPLALRALTGWTLTEGRLTQTLQPEAAAFTLSLQEAEELWRKRGRNRPRPNPERYSQAATLGLG
jgi:SAM-dependent methyltransferase